MIIKNEHDILAHMLCDPPNYTLSIERVKTLIEKYLYKYTDCGAFIVFYKDGVELGSIVEGSDAEVSTDKLPYPFPSEDWDSTIEYIEGEASALWEEANGQLLEEG